MYFLGVHPVWLEIIGSLTGNREPVKRRPVYGIHYLKWHTINNSNRMLTLANAL